MTSCFGGLGLFMAKILLIGAGGFIGAVGRYGLSGVVHRFVDGLFPVGTLFVNTLGCLVIGALMCLVEERQFFAPETRTFLMIGVLGSFTTLSTVGYETFEFMRSGEYWLAGVNAAANLGLGIAAVALGWVAVKAAGV